MSSRLRAFKAALFAWVAALGKELHARGKMLDHLLSIQAKKLHDDQAAQGGSVTQIVVVGATLLIGIIVMAQIVESMPSTENNTFQNAMDRVESVLDSSFLLAAILPLVIIAGALLFYVRNFSEGGRR